MARKKWIFKKWTLPIVVFFRATMFFFISWAPRPSCSHQFFFYFEAPITFQNDQGQLSHRFLFIFLLSRKLLHPSDFFEKKQWDKKLNLGPTVFFIFPHIIFEKNHGRCAHRAPMSFIPPMVLTSLLLCHFFA